MDPSPLAARLHVSTHDSPLGRWRETICLPHPELHGLVAMSWLGDGVTAYRRSRLLPRGLAFLLVNLGPPQYMVDRAGGPPRLFRDLWFCGQQQTYLEIEAPHGTTLLGIAFAPVGAYVVLGAPQSSFAGEVVELQAVLGDGVRALRERLLETGGTAARLALVEAWLRARVRRGRADHPATRWAAARIAATGGRARVDELAHGSGLSRQRLHELFSEQVGIPAKALARIHRFQRAVALLRGAGLPAAAVAADCGYYDQSHLIRDLKALAGCTPGQLQAAAAPDDATLVVA